MKNRCKSKGLASIKLEKSTQERSDIARLSATMELINLLSVIKRRGKVATRSGKPLISWWEPKRVLIRRIEYDYKPIGLTENGDKISLIELCRRSISSQLRCFIMQTRDSANVFASISDEWESLIREHTMNHGRHSKVKHIPLLLMQQPNCLILCAKN